MKKNIFLCIALLAAASGLWAQPQPGWHNQSPESGVYGVSTQKAYELLKNKKPQTVIVAVIDTGMDIDHQALKDQLWINEKEVPANGKDDDGNGYVDDYYGWNFIGGKDGRNVKEDTYEITREIVRCREYFAGKDLKKLTPEEKEFYAYYKKVEKLYREKYDYYKDREKEAGAIKDTARKKMYMDLVNEALDYSLNPDFDPREIVGDNYADPAEKYYGNSDVKASTQQHGTHVSGIIAAAEKKDQAVGGIARDVARIMTVRVVPDGDERDKDVANAIRYAADMGARVINMSFGKPLSPYRKEVMDAIRYAASKDVLMIAAAGNDALNVDRIAHYPGIQDYPQMDPYWIKVGASSYSTDVKKIVASFSNYGKNTVDLFAPGVQIYSTLPGSQYGPLSGTSMASPVVAGIAALIRAYYPELTAPEVRQILVDSVTDLKNKRVKLPGSTHRLIRFGRLSATGGIVNAENAVRLAEQRSK